MKILLSTFYVIFFCFILFGIIWGSEELAVDPLSIFADPNLYRFCWDQIGPIQNNSIEGSIKGSSPLITITFKAFHDDQYGKDTYCIENRDRTNSYCISLPITKWTSEPKKMKFIVRFNQPLAPPFDFIRYKTVPRGIHFELDPEFVGLTSTADPLCQVLLILELSKTKSISLFKIFQRRPKFQTIEPGSSFSLYYTCTLEEFIDISTRSVMKRGVLGFMAKTKDLEPIIQLPLRRFIVASWKNSINRGGRYDIAIYEKSLNDADICVKLFRIYLNIMPTSSNSPRILAPNCDNGIPIEDLDYFERTSDPFISVTLDMITPLKFYSTYKLSIFWVENYGDIMVNYLPLNLLPNENSGNINNNVFKYKYSSYEDLLNESTSSYQTVLSKNNVNPFKLKNVNITGYSQVDVRSSVTPIMIGSVERAEELVVSKLYEICKKVLCSNNFFPYFYAIYYLPSKSGTFAEIVQLPLPQDDKVRMYNITFIPNEKEYSITVSWKIEGFPYSTTPAMFAVEIINDEDGTCHSTYLIKCRTCNAIYLEDTLYSATMTIRRFRDRCRFFKESQGQYDAVDRFIKFKTDKMPLQTYLKAVISSFKFDKILRSEFTPRVLLKTIEFEEPRKNIYIYIIIGIVSAIVLIGLSLVLYCCCRHKKRIPGKKRKFSFLPKNAFEHIYDKEYGKNVDDDVYDKDEPNDADEEIYDEDM